MPRISQRRQYRSEAGADMRLCTHQQCMLPLIVKRVYIATMPNSGSHAFGGLQPQSLDMCVHNEGS